MKTSLIGISLLILGVPVLAQAASVTVVNLNPQDSKVFFDALSRMQRVGDQASFVSAHQALSIACTESSCSFQFDVSKSETLGQVEIKPGRVSKVINAILRNPQEARDFCEKVLVNQVPLQTSETVTETLPNGKKQVNPRMRIYCEANPDSPSEKMCRVAGYPSP